MTLYRVTMVNINETHATDPRFVEKCEKLQSYLNISGMINYLCLHEGSHLVYSRRGKFKTSIHGPAIEYVRSGDRDGFFYAHGSVEHPEIIEGCSLNARALLGFARMALSPNLLVNVFLAELNPNSALNEQVTKDKEIVEKNDFDEFEKRCRWAAKFPNDVIFQPPEYWRRAQRYLEKDLKNGERLIEIKRAAEEIRPKFQVIKLEDLPSLPKQLLL